VRAVTSTTSTRTARAKAAAAIPPGDVAVVAGTPISRATLDHWIEVAAKSASGQAPGMSTVAPTDPPAFTHCIARVRALTPSLAKSRANVLRRVRRRAFRPDTYCIALVAMADCANPGSTG